MLYCRQCVVSITWGLLPCGAAAYVQSVHFTFQPPGGPSALGPRIVARAWVDGGFRAALLEDAQRALAEWMGVDATNATAPTKLIVVANKAGVHNLVVCTLCSCYPLSILGLSPSWYKDVRYRARCVRAPRALLAEFGTALPEATAVCVHDSTADCRYVVLPERPIGTEGWSEAELVALVTRDSMIGVSLPTVCLSRSKYSPCSGS